MDWHGLTAAQGVEAYEPRVVHQLLDFMYGYVSGVLQDAEVTRLGQTNITSNVGWRHVMTPCARRQGHFRAGARGRLQCRI